MTMQLSEKITVEVEITRSRASFNFFKAKTNRTLMVYVNLLFLEVRIRKQRIW